MLVYYPKEYLEKIKAALKDDHSQINTFYEKSLYQLILLTSYCGKKYSRSKVRKALPKKYAYILEELLTELKKDPLEEKPGYCQGIMQKIIALDQGEDLILAVCDTICRLVVDHLHVVGDIYDRGSDPDKIMDRLMAMPSVDIQWGNHDMNWIGAMAGSKLSMINLIRISARYDNLAILEESYGINLRPLIQFAKKYYQPKDNFQPKKNPDHHHLGEEEGKLLNMLQQAASVLQFKLEDALISRRKDFNLSHRQVLRKIDFQQETYFFKGKNYPLIGFPFSQFNPENPGELTKEEEQLLQQLLDSFQNSQRLKSHTDFLLAKGGMYLCYNHNLLFHGCIPLHDNGDLKSLRINGVGYGGKELLDYYEKMVRKSYSHPEIKEDLATDLLWYLWCGECSSLFGKLAMTTFERYYLEDTRTHKEEKNAYYSLRNDPKIIEEILNLFNLQEDGHIINGHTPVKEKRGEDPIKAQGKMLVIDGGFAKSYQKTTGIAGYTLVYNSFGMQLVSHLGFTSPWEIIASGEDVLSTRRLVEEIPQRMLIKETNIGKKLLEDKKELESLYENWNLL